MIRGGGVSQNLILCEVFKQFVIGWLLELEYVSDFGQYGGKKGIQFPTI